MHTDRFWGETDDRPASQRSIEMIDPSIWEGIEPQPQQWILDGAMPRLQATLLTGSGSSGKSLFGQQLATCVSIGAPLLGIDTVEAKALYLTCEDDLDALQLRQRGICKALGVPERDLSGRLYLASLVGEIGNELALFDTAGRISASPLFASLRNLAIDNGIGLIVLDNTAHLFAGNENDRHHVAGFVGLLNKLAAEIGGAVLLIGHPNKSGAEFSGSTAWTNQVRSRLFMEAPIDENGNVLDPDARTLRRAKSNYARNGETVEFRWHDWAFVRPDDLPVDQRAEIAANVKASTENIAFMRCLAAATERRQAVSDHSGTNLYSTIFPRMKEARGVKKAGFEAAFQRLLGLGEIELDKKLWQRENRAWKCGIKAAEKRTDHLHRPPAPTDPQPIENACTDPHAPTTLYTTYKSGAGPDGPLAPVGPVR